jgi:hypothetical protein
MNQKMIFEEKLASLESKELKTSEDYEKVWDFLNVLQFEIYDYCEKQKEFDRYIYLRVKKFFVLLALENLKKQIKLQLKLRFNIFLKLTDRNKFDFLQYFRNLNSFVAKNSSFAELCYSTIKPKNFEKLPENIKIIIKQFEEYENMLEKALSKYLVEFYSQPIDEKMAKNISKDILTAPL